MINPFNEVSWNPNRAQRRSFALALIVGFPIVALLFLAIGYWRGDQGTLGSALVIAGSGVGAGLVFLAAPAIVRPFYVVWYFVACCIGIVVANVLMGAIFYVVVGGLALGMRIFGRKGMKTRSDRSVTSYWIDAGPRPTEKSYFHQF